MVQLVQGFKTSIRSEVQLDKCPIARFDWFEGSIGLCAQFVQGFNMFKGSNGSRVQQAKQVELVQASNWVKRLNPLTQEMYVVYQQSPFEAFGRCNLFV